MTHSRPLPTLAILAGGLATRHGERTRRTPKALLPVAGEPFVAHQLRLAARQGFRDVVLCIGHLGDAIRQFVGDGTAFGVKVRFSRDGESLLGTGGALRQARALLSDPFVVVYGDSYLDIDVDPVLEAFHRSGAPALMTVLHNRDRWERSNARFDGVRVSYCKRAPTPDMQHVDFGLGVLRASTLDDWQGEEPFDLADVYERISSEGRLAGFETSERIFEIGSEQGLAETDARLGATERIMTATISDYTRQYLDEVCQIARRLDTHAIERMIDALLDLRANGGRLFVLGVGGSAGNASHAVNDFRKIVGIESYAPTDNVSELTARVNDEGWEGVFARWLETSRISERDAMLVLSVGGGDREKRISANLVEALDLARAVGAKVLGIVGRDGGHTAKVADACVVVPTMSAETVTPHTEAFQAVVWHLIVSHPRLKKNEMKWESVR